MDGLFEFLFKYRPIVFERGDFAFTAPWPIYVLSVVGAIVVVPTVLRYARARGKSGPIDRALLSGIRVAVLALLLFALFRPVLVLSTIVPQRNFLGIILDDSRSMRIADEGTTRAEILQEHFGAEQSPLIAALSDRFILRFFRFSAEAERVPDASGLAFAGNRTDVGKALDRARQELASVPVAGLVLVSDGADNTHEQLDEPLLALQSRGLPVYAVGVGNKEFPRDIQVNRVETPRSVLKGASVVVDVAVSQTGYTGQAATLVVEDNGLIVNTHDFTLPEAGEVATIQVPFTAREAGPREYAFRIAAHDGEIVTRNNEQEALIVVNDRVERILYFEGEPRFEVGFLRRAVADDENLRVVTVQRTAENKFYRLGVDNPDELLGGFPKTREELFQFRGLVLGSVEASFFTHDQLTMIADFVSQRGGGLLMLGGRRAFAEGGFAGTPVADVLPVELDAVGGEEEPYFAELSVALTPAGRTHPTTQIADDLEASEERWATLPAVTTVNRVTEVKPGATTLLEARGSDVAPGQVVLAFQRYGRGKTVAFPIQDSWMWQMHADIPLEDMTHETFWRQLLRWLVNGVPDRVQVNPTNDRIGLDEPISLLAEVEDDTYLRVNNTEVMATVTTPSGMTETLPLEWTVDRDGEYRGSLMPKEEGLYEVKVDARQGGEFIASASAFLRVEEPNREFFDAEMQQTGLERIAEETAGRFYTPATLSDLPEDISFTESGTTVQEQHDLWDMPIVFLLLLTLVSAEWGYRRFRGLV